MMHSSNYSLLLLDGKSYLVLHLPPERTQVHLRVNYVIKDVNYVAKPEDHLVIVKARVL